ncbi:hypothetical protein MNBD_GAMMA07-1937 [hydrothermal vent metagenome]|uniref:Uncharacterized protein n=1 Tax=hydrothermal vent metagenome TaxID=652676 RepID=A0A3B0WUP3_9ZZZZ
MGEVKPFKMTKEKMSKVLKNLAQDSGNITFVNECAEGEWESTVNYLQMIECLKYGSVLTEPTWDEKTKTQKCTMGYFHAGQDIVLDIAIEPDQHLYILNVCEQN